jgi:parvulin-like peptidyl-prolyl isomerase
LKIRRTAALLSAGLLLCSGPAGAAKLVNRTLATVNGESILLSEFEKNWEAFMEQQRKLLPPSQITPAWENEVKKKILQQMIDDRILLQEAKKRKVRVNQRDLENGVIQVKSRFLSDEGRRELEALVQKQVAATAQPEREPDMSTIDLPGAWRELAKSKPGLVKDAEAKFQQELAKEGLSVKKFEDRIREQLSVVQLTQQEVRLRTEAPTKKEVEALYDQVTDVMKGKKITGVDEERAADLESLAKFFSAQTGERLRARHILIRVGPDAEFKEKSAARRKLEEIRKKILAGEDFDDMARKHSDDKASAERGGDLGVFGRGQMVPPFEKAAFSLSVGEVSSIVETDFGYHLIQVQEKRAASKLRFEDAEEDLKEYAFRVKAQETFEKFVEDLRKDASVKVHMDVGEVSKN